MYAYNGTTQSPISGDMYFQVSPPITTNRLSLPQSQRPTPVPGVIEAENFDTRGEVVAYHYTSLISPRYSNYRV